MLNWITFSIRQISMIWTFNHLNWILNMQKQYEIVAIYQFLVTDFTNWDNLI